MTDDFFTNEEGFRARARKEATARGLDPDTFERQLEVESGFNPNAVGPQTKYGRAKGIAQFLDSTAKQYGVSDPFNPEQAIEGAAKYRADLNKKFGGDERKSVIGYHSGEGAVEGVLRNPEGNPKSTAYANKILGQQPGDDFFTADEVREITGAPKPKPAQRPRRANVRSPLIKAQQTPAPGPFDYRTDPVAADLTSGKYSVPPEIEREARRDRDLQQQAKQRKREEYARKPLLERAGRQIKATVAGGVLPVAQGVENVARWAGVGDPAALHADTENLKATVAEQEEADPSTVGSVARAIGSAAISAPVYVAPALATGGAAIPAVAGATALTEDWSDPKRALANIGVNAAGMGAGKLASPAIAKIAGKVGSDLGEKLLRALGEGVVGGGTNVAGTAATDGARAGEVNPDNLIKSAIVGAALSGVPELGRGRGGARARATAPATPDQLPAPVVRELSAPAPATQLRSPVTSNPTGFHPITRPAGSKSAQFRPEGAYPTLTLPDDPRFSSRPTGQSPADAAKSKLRQLAERIIPTDRLVELEEARGREESTQSQLPPPGDDITYRHGGVGGILPQPWAARDPNARYTSGWDLFSAVRKGNPLMNLKTHERNAISNLVAQAADEISRVPAAIADIGMSLGTKQRTITAGRDILPSWAQGGREGLANAASVFRHGLNDAQAREAESAVREIRSRSPLLDAALNTTFKGLRAVDEFSQSIAYERALRDRARAEALTLARQGKIKRSEIAETARDLAQYPTDSLSMDALADAQALTFNNGNLAERALRGFKEAAAKSGTPGRALNAAIDFVVPYTKTPTNLAKYAFYDHTPLGLAQGLGGASKVTVKSLLGRAVDPAEQRKYAQLIGRGSIGSALIGLGWELGEKGLVTGTPSADYGERERDKAEGREPGSINIGGRWVNVGWLPPFGSLVVLGATLQRESNRPLENESLRTSKIARALGETVMQFPIAAGTRDIAEALSGEGNLAQRLARTAAGAFVPSIVSQTAEALDRPRVGEGVLGPFEKATGIRRKLLPEATDALGRPLPPRGLKSLIDPFNVTPGRTTPFLEEMRQRGEGLAPARDRDRNLARGDILSQKGDELVRTPAYMALDPQTKRRALELLKQRVGAAAALPEGKRASALRFSAQSIILAAKQSREDERRRRRAGGLLEGVQ